MTEAGTAAVRLHLRLRLRVVHLSRTGFFTFLFFCFILRQTRQKKTRIRRKASRVQNIYFFLNLSFKQDLLLFFNRSDNMSQNQMVYSEFVA